MERKFGVFILAGLAIGAIFGVALGAGMDKSLMGVALGALAGVFLGWFAAAIAMKREETK